MKSINVLVNPTSRHAPRLVHLPKVTTTHQNPQHHIIYIGTTNFG